MSSPTLAPADLTIIANESHVSMSFVRVAAELWLTSPHFRRAVERELRLQRPCAFCLDPQCRLENHRFTKPPGDTP